MKRVLFLLIITANLFACKQSSSSVKENKTVFIRMERTPCFGRCQSYIITIYDNGNVMYEGKTFAEKQGKHTTTLSNEELTSLRTKIKEIDFFNLKDKYDQQITDIPSCFISVKLNGKEKQIIDRVGGPKELKSFEKMIDTMIITDRLDKIEE